MAPKVELKTPELPLEIQTTLSELRQKIQAHPEQRAEILRKRISTESENNKRLILKEIHRDVFLNIKNT